MMIRGGRGRFSNPTRRRAGRKRALSKGFEGEKLRIFFPIRFVLAERVRKVLLCSNGPPCNIETIPGMIKSDTLGKSTF